MLRATAARDRTLAERRVVTVLFCDLVGSTELSQRLDPEALRELLASYHAVCGDLIQAADGHVAQYLGDGLLAYFGWPRTHEDDAVRALRCALKVVRALGELAPLHGVQLRARLGADTGAVVVSSVGGEALRENLALGDTPNVAARIQALAEPGTVLASDRTWKLAQGYFEGTSLGCPSLKGVSQAVGVWRVDSESGARSRLEAAARLSPFVGRDVQLGQTLAFVNDAAAGIQVLDVAGEPGIGKSRLLSELHARIRSHKATLVLVGTCGPDRQATPLSPFAEILRGLIGPSAGDLAAGIARMLQVSDMDSATHRGLIALLLDVPPPQGSLDGLDGTLIGLRTREVLVRLLTTTGEQRQVVVLLEDLHWLDAASLDLLTRIVALQGLTRVRIITTRRPEFSPPWQRDAQVRTLVLPPLSGQATAQIIAARLGAELLGDMAAQLASRAEGNALFAEELASYFTASVGRHEGDLRPEALLQSMPDSVRGLLDARVDSLDPADRTLMQAAAVIGRRFDVALLAELMPELDDLTARIERLTMLDLLVSDDGVGCSFKHALIQEAMYGRMLRTRVAALHAQVAHCLERRHANDLDDVAEALAFHWSRAEQPQRAVAASIRAGRKAMNRFALDDAGRHLLAAERTVAGSPEDFAPNVILSMLRPLVYLQYMRLEVASSIELVQHYIKVIYGQLPRPDAVHVLALYTLVCCIGRKLREAADEVGRVWAASLEQPDLEARAWAAMAYLSANVIAMQGRGTDYVQVLAEAERLSTNLNEPHAVNGLMTTMAWDAFGRGRYARAEEIALQLAARGRDLNDPRAEAVSLWLRGWVEFNDERYSSCVSKVERVIQIAETPYDLILGKVLKGLALIFSGRSTEGIQLVEQCQQECHRSGALYISAPLGFGFPVALIMAGHPAEGVARLDAAIEDSVRCGDRWINAQLLAVKAEILMSFMDPPPEVRLRDKLRMLLWNPGFCLRVMPNAPRAAEALLRQALEYPLFADPDAYWHARVTTNLALLGARRGPRAAARERLLEARGLAQMHDARALIAKVDRALARLGE